MQGRSVNLELHPPDPALQQIGALLTRTEAWTRLAPVAPGQAPSSFPATRARLTGPYSGCVP